MIAVADTAASNPEWEIGDSGFKPAVLLEVFSCSEADEEGIVGGSRQEG
jgi:hypothetical protein